MNFYTEIKERYGCIKRCRGFYLYAEKARIFDMYLDSGMSLLGRRESQADLTLKQFTDKGLCSFLPSSADYNLKKALNTLFPEHPEIRFYTNFKDENKVLKLKTEEQFLSNLWRPFLPSAECLRQQSGFFVQPARCTNLKIAVFKSEFAGKLLESCNVTAAEKAALARSFFNVIRLSELETETGNVYSAYSESGQRRRAAGHENKQPAYPPHTACTAFQMPAGAAHGKKGKNCKRQIVQSYTRAAELCAAIWRQEGIYLFPKIKKGAYETLFKKALDSKILISPDFNIPSILPKIKTYTELINFLKGYFDE